MPALVPEHLAEFWTQHLWALHADTWWRRHWERTGLVDVRTADTMSDGWKLWSAWQPQVAPNNVAKIATLEADTAAT